MRRGQRCSNVSHRSRARRIGFQRVVGLRYLVPQPGFDGPVTWQLGAQPAANYLALRGILAGGDLRADLLGHFNGLGNAELLG